MLETLGVPVLGWRTERCRSSTRPTAGRPSPQRVESAEEAAQVGAVPLAPRPPSGIVLARPPDESLDVEPLIAEGVEEAARRGIRGQAVTPFVLSYLHEQSGGRTIAVNKQLIAENAGSRPRSRSPTRSS